MLYFWPVIYTSQLDLPVDLLRSFGAMHTRASKISMRKRNCACVGACDSTRKRVCVY